MEKNATFRFLIFWEIEIFQKYPIPKISKMLKISKS